MHMLGFYLVGNKPWGQNPVSCRQRDSKSLQPLFKVSLGHVEIIMNAALEVCLYTKNNEKDAEKNLNIQ